MNTCIFKIFLGLENPGIDPGTSRMLSERSTIWANSPAYYLWEIKSKNISLSFLGATDLFLYMPEVYASDKFSEVYAIQVILGRFSERNS